MKNKYEKEYHQDRHSHLYKNNKYYKLRSKVFKYDLLKLLPHIEMIEDIKILDYGGGLGQNTYLFKNTTLYDKSEFAVKFCKNRKNRNATNKLKEIKNNNFDIIVCSEVLEHVENPLKELKDIRKKLNSNGYLILVLPVDKWNKPDIFDQNQHLYNWNFNTITNLISRAGFFPKFYSYEIWRRTGFYKLMNINKISFRLYLMLTKLLAIVTGSKHIVIVAEKL